METLQTFLIGLGILLAFFFAFSWLGSVVDEEEPYVATTEKVFDKVFEEEASTSFYRPSAKDVPWTGASGSLVNYPPYWQVNFEKLHEEVKDSGIFPKTSTSKCSWCGSYKKDIRCEHCGGE